jgi:hypothetical protein
MVLMTHANNEVIMSIYEVILFADYDISGHTTPR